MARVSGKLTGKALGWDRNAIGTATKRVPQDTGRVFIGRIGGIVSGLHQTVDDNTGNVQTGLKGSFRGISSLNELVQDGDKKDATGAPVMVDSGKPITVTAGRCYLPGGLQDMIEGAYAQATENDAKATVNFLIDLYAIPATNQAGYSYDADTISEPVEADPLDMLFNGGAAKALPGATATAAIEDGTDKVDPAPEPAPEPAPVAKGKAAK